MANKIIHDRDICIGCGACAVICPLHWEMDPDGKVNLKGAKKEGKEHILEVEDIGCSKEAATSCPVNCIHIEKNGEREI
ncbi:ferredoxin [Candidatus Micrarchaeota archaeon]|nr:ferredoxin [Candidatus Micrarchaeota archaeon]